MIRFGLKLLQIHEHKSNNNIIKENSKSCFYNFKCLSFVKLDKYVFVVGSIQSKKRQVIFLMEITNIAKESEIKISQKHFLIYSI